jgi:hypothetical protein
MEEKSSNPLGLAPSTWITLAIAFMGIFALKQIPFQDSRPPDHWSPVYSHAASEDQDVEARLWQDPLAAVETARDAYSVQAAKKSAADLPPQKKPIICTGNFDGNPGAAALLSNVHSAPHLCKAIVTTNEASPVLVIAAMVSGAPYAADIEDRRRTRYAVIAALYRANYMPVNSGHVGYVHLTDFYDDPAHANDLAAFEWFVDVTDPRDKTTGPTRPGHVLLMWLDQDGFRTTTPMAQFSRIADGIMPINMPAVLLGPADSDSLREIVRESKAQGAAAQVGSRPITIYSPRATAADEVITADGSSPVPTQIAPNIRLYRTIATDKTVASRMLSVLQDREVRLDEIALIVERDTLYGRTMGENFQGCANAPRAEPGKPFVDESKNPHPICLTYLRGLDGIGPPPPKRTGNSVAANANYSKSVQTNHTGGASDASTGPGQLDYLRRMGITLAAMQGEMPAECDPSQPLVPHCHPRYIKAIGVLGTDIYDKLLILQEMRPTFPDATLFTFDLDGRLSDAANLPWTRQLLVGSSLSLSLRPELQGDIPPFRDSYQSATFYATMLALHRVAHAQPLNQTQTQPDALKGLLWTQHPQVFEIGRNKPFDLLFERSTSCDKDLDVKYFDADCASISDTRVERFIQTVSQVNASGVIALGFVVLWLLLRMALGRVHMGKTWGRIPLNLTRLVVILGIFAVLAVRWSVIWNSVFGYLTNGWHYMPPPIADGAGHWGKDLLEASLVPLIISLLIRGQRKLDKHSDRIRTEFSLRVRRKELIYRYACEVRQLPWRRRMGEWVYLPLGHLSNSRDVIPVLGNTSPLESLIARYLYRGMWCRRWLRVLAACVVSGVLFKLMEWLGFSLFAGVPWFATLTQKHGLEGLISGLCLLFVQGLIFWVVDAILLVRAFMLDVARDTPAWPTKGLATASAALGLRSDLTTIWLNLRLISRRTTWVGNFIWYPSLVIAGLFAATFTVQYGQYHFDSNPITLVVSIGLIVSAVVMLRQSAEQWRSDLLEKLAHMRIALLAGGRAVSNAEAQIRLLIEMVRDLEEGAFAPYSQQPLVRAVLLPVVTFAATAGFPYLHAG